MHPVVRTVLTGGAFLAGVVFAQLFLMLWLPDALGFLATLLAWVLAALLARRVWYGLVEPDQGPALSCAIWAATLGGVGFMAGFFGPMLLAPDANQGPLLGIFITGPGGAVLGVVVGWVRWLRQDR